MTHFLFRAQQRGGHVRVGVWAGTEFQAHQHARPKLGDLIMDAEQWDDLRQQLRLAHQGPCIFDVETGRSTPSLKLALAIADALDSTVDALFAEGVA